MAVPKSREQFKEFCLRKLGKPVIEINVDNEQVEDRIDEALHFYWDYHFDGTEKLYYKYKVTAQDIKNQFIQMPDNIIGVVDIFEIGEALNTNNLFNIRYQIALNDLYTLTSVSMIPYYMSLQHIQFLEQLLVGKQPLRYNRNVNKLFIDMDWNVVNEGDYLIVVAYQVVDPAVYTRAWSEWWLQEYATTLIKEQWGTNLKKFDGMKLPGGVSFNGQKIYDEAYQRRLELQKDMVENLSLPATDMIG